MSVSILWDSGFGFGYRMENLRVDSLFWSFVQRITVLGLTSCRSGLCSASWSLGFIYFRSQGVVRKKMVLQNSARAENYWLCVGWRSLPCEAIGDKFASFEYSKTPTSPKVFAPNFSPGEEFSRYVKKDLVRAHIVFIKWREWYGTSFNLWTVLYTVLA
jgi:hypothetical protein